MRAAVERAVKIQEVILRAVAKKITWAQAAEIIGIGDRQMRRWKERYEEFGYDGLFAMGRSRIAAQESASILTGLRFFYPPLEGPEFGLKKGRPKPLQVGLEPRSADAALWLPRP